MGYKRKRTYTRNSIASSESGEDETFLNNSDYEMDGEQKEYLIKSTENVDHRDQRPTDMLSSAEGDLVNSDQLIQKHLNHQEDQEVDCECTNGETADLKDQDSNATHSAKSVAFEEGSLPPSQLSQSKMPLSYSEQKSEVIIQSPTKRRDNYISAVPSNEPRLVIKKLILTNFKSYAGEQEIGPFSPSFSAVVGPNGSGKSNVIDSLLFVFGFRASKMRQGKLSELIHNSSGGEKLPFCQVDIHFHSVLDADSHKAAHVISNSELVVSRKALKNNHSQYYIDGKTSSYSEVTKLLSDKGIDLHHKRFLILQGEVESIAQMKAKAERENEDGLLEYLEDIIGTAKYKDLIEQNLGRMEDLNNVCVEKENRVSLVEKDKDSLEQKKNEALRLLETEKILAIKKSITLQAQILRSRKFIDEEELVIKEMTNRLLKEKEANKVLTDSINEIVAEQNAVLKEMSSLDKNLIPLTKRQRAINKSKVSIEERVKNLTNKIRKSQKSKDQSEHIFTSASHQLEGTKELMSKYNEEILSLTTELEKEKSSLSELREQMKNKTSHLSSKIESYQTKLEPWNDKLKEKESMIHLVTSELEILQNQKDSLNRRLEGARKHLLDIKSSGQQREQELVEAESKLSKIDNQIALGEAQLANDKQEIDSRLHRLNGLRQKTQDSLNSFSNQQNKSRVLSSLQRLARSGRIEGFYGKLGDLGVIDDKYDIAISTACPGLDSIVVETVETAQACIDYLRKNKLGYANFICLNKLRDFNLSIIQTPGNPITVKRLFDLIRPVDPKFARAFYSKIFNTLVASDLSEAKKIAFGPKRWKVVTLDGKVVDTSGTMSGGGSFVAKGGMRLANSGSVENVLSEEEAETLKKRLSYEESDFERISVENQEKIQRYRKLKEMKPETEFRISKLRLDIEALVQEKRQASSILRSMVTERDENDNDTKKLDETIVQKTAERDILCREKEDLKSSMFELESNVKELEEQILEAGGVELRLQNSKVDSIKQQIEIVNEKCSNEKLSLRKTENDLNRHKKIVGELNEEILKVEAELNSIEDEKVSKDKESKSVSDEIETISAQKDVKEQEAERLREKKEEMLSSINEFKSTEIEIENQIEKHVDQVKKDEKRRQAFDIELRDLVIRDTSPYIFWLEGEEKMKYDRTTFENLPEDQLNSLDIEIIEKEVEELERHMDSIKVDVEVLKEYGLKKTEFESRRVDLNSAVEERDLLRSHCEDLKRRRLDEFMEGFNTISMSLKEMYQMITMGGNAELELVDSLDPFSEGIMFSVMPPKKSWKNITNLSGGEKTLSSLALVFALHKYKPTPLYVMDEIDAALDFRNVSIVANYIKERTKNAQFVVISLRNNMFELAQQLVGIYKINNKTKSISLQNKDFSVPA